VTSATFNLKPQTSNILWRIVDLIVGGIFIYAGALKMFDPVRFASDIDNYKILPWTIGVALAFYVPWLEIFCGIALVLRFLYRGGLSILTALVLVFTLATVAAKVRGLDITWLFRSCQPTLEFPRSHRDQSRNSRRPARALFSSCG